MWTWIKSLFAPQTPKPSQHPNPLVMAFQRGECPDCGSKSFYKGPQGGICQNVKCANCGSEFNISLAFGHFPFAERIYR